MSQDQTRSRPPIFSSIDVAQPQYHPPISGARAADLEVVSLLRQLVAGQDRHNELLEELMGQINSNQKQRASELGQWKQANPRLARSCRAAAEALGKVQTEFLDGLTQEIGENYENLMEGEFMLNEFVDRFGPRMAHLNGLLQILSQLARPPTRPALPTRPDVS